MYLSIYILLLTQQNNRRKTYGLAAVVVRVQQLEADKDRNHHW
jgi:hypothetical protein